MKNLTVLFSLFLTLNCWADVHQKYAMLISQNRHQDALRLVCTHYKVDCKKVKIYEEKDLEGTYAVTVNFTNTIRLSKSAFTYNGRAHAGWLGAIIYHENIHQGQSMYVRQVAGLHSNVLKNLYWESVLESEAWTSMLVQSKRFELTNDMLDEIQFNVDDYNSHWN